MTPPQVELGDNKLTGGLETLSQCPELRHLSLVGNRLASVDLLTPLVEKFLSFSSFHTIHVVMLSRVELCE